MNRSAVSFGGRRPRWIRCLLALGGLLVLAAVGSPAVPAADYGYIDLTNPYLRKIPIAIPDFKTVSDDAATVELAARGTRLTTETLDFTGYFAPVDPGAFLVDPKTMGVTEADIDFKAWTGIGSELLITGLARVADGVVDLELRLFDTVKQERLIGKRYTARQDDLRRLIRRFCSEVLMRLTGNPGPFDSQIAFRSGQTGNQEIFTCDFDGYNPRRFTRSGSISLAPSWSSDGQWISYTSYQRGRPDLYIRHRLENRGTVVAENGINLNGEWVPGRLELAATLSFSGDQEIYLLSGSGKIIKRLTHQADIDVSPTFSPDGEKMAFVSKRAGSPQLYIMDMASGRSDRLTFQGPYNTQPSWSPKGDRIAYTAMEKNRIDIRVIDLETRNIIQLTRDSGDNESPSWSPDGSLIAFSSTREGPSRIYVMTSFGTDQRRLLSLPGEQSQPDWSPNGIH
jgi:TolB protein